MLGALARLQDQPVVDQLAGRQVVAVNPAFERHRQVQRPDGIADLPGMTPDRRLVRPTLRGALLGLEIRTSQATLPVGVGRFRRTPHIALSGAFLALRASDCNGWPRRWVSGRRRDWDPGSPWKWTHVISTGSGALRQFPRPH